MIDRYAFGHAAAGAAYRSVGLSWWQAGAVHLGATALQRGDVPPQAIVTDVATALAGYSAAAHVLPELRNGRLTSLLGLGAFVGIAWLLVRGLPPGWTFGDWLASLRAKQATILAARVAPPMPAPRSAPVPAEVVSPPPRQRTARPVNGGNGAPPTFQVEGPADGGFTSDGGSVGGYGG